MLFRTVGERSMENLQDVCVNAKVSSRFLQWKMKLRRNLLSMKRTSTFGLNGFISLRRSPKKIETFWRSSFNIAMKFWGNRISLLKMFSFRWNGPICFPFSAKKKNPLKFWNLSLMNTLVACQTLQCCWLTGWKEAKPRRSIWMCLGSATFWFKMEIMIRTQLCMNISKQSSIIIAENSQIVQTRRHGLTKTFFEQNKRTKKR